MQLLWIGSLESDEEFKIKAKKGCDLASAQVSQKNLLYGLEKTSGLIFDSINGSILPPYPIYQDRDVVPVIWEHKAGSYDISVGYRNDKYINRVYCKKAMLRAADGWIETKYKTGDLIILVYSMRSATMATACHIKRKIPNAKIFLIVTDLPQFMDLGQSKLKAFLKQIDWQNIKKMQKQFDGFVLYASKMAEFLRIPDEKWLFMEGSYDLSENISDIDVEKTTKKKALLYSGKLDKEYGICLLLDSFMQIKDDEIELWFTGGGNAEDYIRECVQKDERIKFYGFLPSRADVLKKQKEAMLLINMRLPSEPASAYCFPSKLFEYMVTGVPVLSFRLEGIPEEYRKHLIIIEDESTKQIMETIIYALEMPDKDRRLLVQKAREFILKKKNSIVQCQKIWNWIQKMIS